MTGDTSHHLTAIVVNDDPIQCGVLCGLAQKAGIEALAFESAEAALSAMNPESPPDLIVTDLHMPGIDGWRFCRLLRSPEYAAYNSVPILVVSATFAGDHPEHITVEIGANAFLASPVDGKEFTARVRSILQGKDLRRLPGVLIADHDRALAGWIKEAFTANGYRADIAATAREAEEFFTKSAYEAAVINYRLPDGTGDTLLETFLARRPDCVCLMMTPKPTPELALSWMKRGASAYVPKPFKPEFLIELCARASRERTLLRTEDLLEMRTRELRQNEARFRNLFMSMSDGFYLSEVLYDDEGEPYDYRYLETNPAFERILGLNREQIVGKTYKEVVPVDTTDWLDTYFKVAKTGEPLLYEFVSPEYHTTFETYSCQPDKGQVMVLVRDISERKRAERALKESEKKFRGVFEAANVGKSITLPSGEMFVNRAFADMLGFSREELSDKTWQELTPPDDLAMNDENIAPLLKGEKDSARFTKRYIHKDGSFVWADVSTAIQCGEDGKPLYFISTIVDITERKRVEEEREKLQVQLIQAQKMESVGRLAGGVAHDFNNMLGIILGHADMALESIGPDDELHTGLEEIKKAAERSADLTRQLLAFARKQTVAPRVIDLNATVEGMLNMLRRLIGENIDLIWIPGKDLAPLKIDPSQIDQILANLCVNARDAITGSGKITIETGVAAFDDDYCSRNTDAIPGNYVMLAVIDDGCGMDHRIIGHLFEPFFTTKEVGKGTGLGLATVYGAVKQNNGFINVFSEPGQGAAFRIYLPRYAERAAAKPEPAPASAGRGGGTILLVEDEPAILRMITEMLDRQNYHVLTARTPGEAIRMAWEHTGCIDLLMTDVVMPEMNGRELAKNLMSIHPGIKRLFMSGYTADVIAHQGVLDEGVHFIYKPFTMKDLEAKIRNALL